MFSKYFNSVNSGSSFKKSSLLLFFIWPVSALYVSFRNYKQDWSKNVLWLFCIFFGYTFIIAGEGGADSDRYARTFLMYAHSELSLPELWSSFYSESSNLVDIAFPLITYLVSRITDNSSILFAVFGLIFGYFYSRNVWYVLDRINEKLTGIVLLYFLTFALFNPIWNINGFRFYAAAQIFLFGTLPYLLEGKSKRLFWAAASLFVHFSFMYAFAVLILFYFIKNRLNIYVVFFILTSFLKEIDLQSVQSTLSFLPDIFQSKVGSYTNIEYAEAIQIEIQSNNWYLPISEKAISWVIYFLALFIYFFCRKFLKTRQELVTLLCFSFLLYGFANISSLVPSGGRFLTVANTFMFAFFIIFISTFSKIRGLPLIEALSSPLLLLFCIVSLRIGMDYYGLLTVLGNPLIAAFYKDMVPLITGIKGLL